MPARLREIPDVLVLGGGGVLGEAWMRGLLSGAEAAGALDFRGCEYYVGTSAGSIVAATLAAGRRPEAGDRAAREWAQEAAAPPDRPASPLARLLREAAQAGTAVATPLAPLALAVSSGGATARAVALAAAPRPERTLDRVGRYVEGLGARFDGRLRIAAVARRTGRRVLFGAPGAPAATVTQAVLASCAVPWLFAPVEIEGREYVDGGVWSPTNLDAAPVRRGARVLCLNPTASLASSRSAYGAWRTLARATARTEALAVRGRGAEVDLVAPDAACARAMATDLMDSRRREDVLDAAFAQGRRLAA